MQSPIRYVGGKSKLLPEINKYIPKDVSHIVEPFCGSATLAFSHEKQCIISDMSPELINFYDVLMKGSVRRLIRLMKRMSSNHDQENYLSIRALDRAEGFKDTDPEYRAARYIYLIYHGFNGMYRVNRSGFNNVPTGGDHREFPDNIESLLKEASQHLLENCKHLSFSSFNSDENENALIQAINAGGKPFVLIDPPYADRDGGVKVFREYTKDPITVKFYEDLLDYMRWLDSCDIPFLMTNTDCEFIREYFSEFIIDKVPTKYSIGANKERTGCKFESFVSNKGVCDDSGNTITK